MRRRRKQWIYKQKIITISQSDGQCSIRIFCRIVLLALLKLFSNARQLIDLNFIKVDMGFPIVRASVIVRNIWKLKQHVQVVRNKRLQQSVSPQFLSDIRTSIYLKHNVDRCAEVWEMLRNSEAVGFWLPRELHALCYLLVYGKRHQQAWNQASLFKTMQKGVG